MTDVKLVGTSPWPSSSARWPVLNVKSCPVNITADAHTSNRRCPSAFFFVDTIREETLRYFKQNHGHDWQAAYDWLIFNGATPVKETELTTAVKRLLDEKEIHRVGGPGVGIRKGLYSPVQE